MLFSACFAAAHDPRYLMGDEGPSIRQGQSRIIGTRLNNLLALEPTPFMNANRSALSSVPSLVVMVALRLSSMSIRLSPLREAHDPRWTRSSGCLLAILLDCGDVPCDGAPAPDLASASAARRPAALLRHTARDCEALTPK